MRKDGYDRWCLCRGRCRDRECRRNCERGTVGDVRGDTGGVEERMDIILRMEMPFPR